MNAVRWALAVMALVLGLSVAAPSQAGTISGTGDTLVAIPGGTKIDFESVEPDSYSVLNVNGVTFSAPEDLIVSDSYDGQYNTTGQSLYNNGYGASITVHFPRLVSAVAFRWGAADVTWRLTAYSYNGAVVETMDMTPTGEGNAGTYYGVTGQGILSVTLQSLSGDDFVFVDDFTYLEMPDSALAWLVEARELLDSLTPSEDPSINRLVGMAIIDINKALRAKNWEDYDHLTKNGRDVFAGLREAVLHLMPLLKKYPIPNAPAINKGSMVGAIYMGVEEMVEVARRLAEVAINDYIGEFETVQVDAKNGIDLAMQQYSEGLMLQAQDDYRAAIDMFSAAWRSARRAMDKANMVY